MGYQGGTEKRVWNGQEGIDLISHISKRESDKHCKGKRSGCQVCNGAMEDIMKHVWS